MIGQTISHYRILEQLGAGGMGVVFKAEDLELGRAVALKFLPEHDSEKPEALERFRREARLASSLNHPNICTVYEIGQQDGRSFIAMEALDGTPLSQKIGGRPLPISQVIALGTEIAYALESAHAAGVLHRDIKSSNIFVTSLGHAKVLDFGLAKGYEPPGSATTLAGSKAELTSPGVALGTVAYMSPEQALGQPIDHRSDLFSFGVVLYEMATGVLPFEGTTAAAQFDGILHKTPTSPRQLNPEVPAQLETIIFKALEKKPELRCQSAAEVRADLKRLQRERDSTSSGIVAPAHTQTSRYWAVAVVVALLFALLYVTIRKFQPRSGAGAPLNVALTQLTSTEGLQENPSWSPDGTQIAYVRDVGGRRKLFIKPLTGDAVQLTSGDQDEVQPTWMPDGKSILVVRASQPGGKLQPGDIFGSYDNGNIWKVDLQTKSEQMFLQNAFHPVFSRDGKWIAVDASWVGPRRIYMVDAQGHNPIQVTTDSTEAAEHLSPSWSPDGSHIVFQHKQGTKFSIRVVDVASKKTATLTDPRFQDFNLNPVWSNSGKYVYFSSYRSGGLNIWRLPVSHDGVATGAPQQVTLGAGQDVELSISSNGNRLAFTTLRQNADLWRLPVSPATGMPTGEPVQVLGTTREDSRAAWSPDGKQLAFNSDRSGQMNLYIYSFDGGTTRQLTNGPGGDYQSNWSPDSSKLTFFSSRAGNSDIWTVDVATGALHQLTTEESLDINPFFSPDGKQIVFQSDRSGRLELWLMSASGAEQRQLSHTGVIGHFVRWTEDGSGIIYRCTCPGGNRAAKISAAGGEPTLLPEQIKGGAHLSFSPDFSTMMDVIGHKVLWASKLAGGEPLKVFEFPDGESRIDYPVWSSDGKWVIFDRDRPQGGDIWAIDGIE